MKKILIGTRGSKLSLAYAQKVKNLLIQANKDLETLVDIKTISTTGDKKKGRKTIKNWWKKFILQRNRRKIVKR